MAKAQFTLGHQVVLEGLYVLAYAVDYRYRKHVLTVLLVSSVYAAFFMSRIGATPFPLSDLYLGMRGFAVLLFTSADLLIRDAQKEYRRIGDKRDIPSLPFRSRLWWAFQLAYNQRGVNWNVEVPGLPPKPTEKTRREFILASLRQLCFWLVVEEVNVWILKQNPYFAPNPTKVEGWQWLWMAYTCGYAFITMTQLSLNYCWTMVILSALGFTEPSDWAMPFGSLKDTYSLATFWGKTWHATYKRVFVIYAKFASNLLGLKKGSAAANFVGLLVIFFLSAVMHVLGDYAMFGDMKMSGGSMIFFMVQVPGLLFEQFVIRLAGRAGVRSAWWTYAIGYIWVYSWCALTMPYWIGPHLAKGYWGMRPKYEYGVALSMIVHEFKLL